MKHSTRNVTLLLPIAACFGILTSCGAPAPRVNVVPNQPPLTPSAATVALVEKTPITTEDLRPALFELAGREALREAALDLALRGELQRRGLSVTNEAIERERTLFDTRMTGTDDERASQMVADEVYRSRGLGPSRRRAMFWRNAALRMLVADSTAVENTEVETAMELAYGPKIIARLILTEHERDAGEVLKLLGPAPTTMSFARLAEQRSIDPTASRGGLLPPVHLADAQYPQAVRDALGSLTPGSVSSIIPLASGSVLLMVERREPRQTPPAGAWEQLRTELRVQRERAAMDVFARRLLAEARIDVLDRSLGWSWDGR